MPCSAAHTLIHVNILYHIVSYISLVILRLRCRCWISTTICKRFAVVCKAKVLNLDIFGMIYTGYQLTIVLAMNLVRLPGKHCTLILARYKFIRMYVSM